MDGKGRWLEINRLRLIEIEIISLCAKLFILCDRNIKPEVTLIFVKLKTCNNDDFIFVFQIELY